MLYPGFPLTAERGLPLDIARGFDFEEINPTAPGVSFTLAVRAARGSSTTLLDLRSQRGEIAVTPVEGSIYAIALHATRAQMDRMAAGSYVYGLLLQTPADGELLMVDGPWDHQGAFVLLDQGAV